MDIYLTLVWLQSTIRTKQIVPNNCIAYPDLLYIRHAGSTIDKAILAYGTLCNMKKDTDFWSADDLYVLITDDYKGYLAVNLNKDWKYLSFEKGILLSNTTPPNVTMVFNEIESTDTWEK
ncbi:MAG: hypothetical protein JSV67_03230 [Thermoplasmatales archaeon]|nr:MAG: hypothetical protein JSV67_03230 [Thermoplasmatales archaeon]